MNWAYFGESLWIENILLMKSKKIMSLIKEELQTSVENVISQNKNEVKRLFCIVME